MTTSDDQAAITRVLAEYCRTCDDGRFDAFGELWADDAVLVIGDEEWSGRAAVVGEIERRQPPDRRGLHMTSNTVVDGDGDAAHVESDYVFLRMGSSGRLYPSVMGRYVDRLERGGDGRWRFARREIRFFPPRA
jgi:ketosteroid isomerase-like protein